VGNRQGEHTLMDNFGPYYQRAITGGQNLETGDINARYSEEQSSLTGGMPALRGYSPAITNPELAQTATDTGTNVTGAAQTGVNARPTSPFPFGNFIGGFLGPTVTSAASGASGTNPAMAGLRGLGSAAIGYGLSKLPGAPAPWTSFAMASGVPQATANALAGAAGLPAVSGQGLIPPLASGLSKLGMGSAAAITPYLGPAMMLGAIGWAGYNEIMGHKKEERQERRATQETMDAYAKYKSQIEPAYNELFKDNPNVDAILQDPVLRSMIMGREGLYRHPEEWIYSQGGIPYTVDMPYEYGPEGTTVPYTSYLNPLTFFLSPILRTGNQDLLEGLYKATRDPEYLKELQSTESNELTEGKSLDPFKEYYLQTRYNKEFLEQSQKGQREQAKQRQAEWTSGGGGQF